MTIYFLNDHMPFLNAEFGTSVVPPKDFVFSQVQ